MSCFGGADTNESLWKGTCISLQFIASNGGVCDEIEEEPDSRAAALYNIPVQGGMNYFIEWDDQDSGDGFNFYIDEHL